jgi:hypothetical protein
MYQSNQKFLKFLSDGITTDLLAYFQFRFYIILFIKQNEVEIRNVVLLPGKKRQQ